MGNAAPHGLPVAGLTLAGPVEPKHEPRLLTPITKNRVVSNALPGPTMLYHQPISLGSLADLPATCCDAFQAWHTSTAIVWAPFNVPKVFTATSYSDKTWPMANRNGSLQQNNT